MTGKKRRHTKISDIAQKLKVSNVSVSKALRGHPDISPETTAKIKKVAMEMGYVPNFMARRLSARHSQTIGVIVPKIAHFFFSRVIEAIYNAAFENKYEILLMVSQENAEREAVHLQTLLSMRVDGLIVSVSQETQSAAAFRQVLDRGVPLTFMDRVMRMKGANTVVADDRGGAFAATERAIQAGYRRVGHLAGPRHLHIAKERLGGFQDALDQYGVPLDPSRVVFGGFGEDNGYKGFMELYSTGNLPEFIFTVSFPVALGVMRAAKELGLVVTRDFDLIAFGSGWLNEFLSPSLTIVDQPTTTLGREAFELTLLNIMEGSSFKPRHIQLPTRLVMGETCVGREAVKGTDVETAQRFI
jgi:LacI family transcriptional regulator